MNKKSMLDVAFDIISEKDYSKNGIAFADLLEEIGRRLEMTEEELCKKASNFYTDLLRDGRFVTLGENTWDLRTRHKFEKVHIDMNEIYREEEENTINEDSNDATVEQNTDLYDKMLEESRDDDCISDDDDYLDNPGFSINDSGDDKED